MPGRYLGPAGDGRWPPFVAAFGDGVRREDLVNPALGWLAGQTPQVERLAAAETLISACAQDQLAVPSPGGPQ